MKKTLLTILILIFKLSLPAQNIIDIEIDEVYINSEEFYLINRGEINVYSCELTSIKIRDFEHSLQLNCEEDNNYLKNQNLAPLDFNELIEFRGSDELLDWFKKKKFAKETNKKNLKQNFFFQYFNDNLLVELSYKNHDLEHPVWVFNKAELWNYIILRINGKHLFLAIVDKDADISGIVIPKKDEPIFISDFKYRESGSIINSNEYLSNLDLSQYYRAKKVPNGYQLKDKLFQQTLISDTFSKIKFSRKYIMCYKNNKTFIFDKSLNNELDQNLTVGYDTLGSIQCIKDNKIQWLDYEGIFHDTFPSLKWALCGTINSTHRSLSKSENIIFESNDSGGLIERFRIDSIILSQSEEIESINYLNNSTKHYYDDYSNLNSVFSFPNNYYVIKNNNSTQLVSISNKRDSIEWVLKYSQDYIMGNQVKRDSMKSVIRGLKNDVDIDTLLEGDLEFYGYYHPIKFKEGNLFGYYPQSKIAKYKHIEKFDFHFAEFELENGKKGWLDIYGNEYFKNE